MSYVISLYHVVINTKNRQMTIGEEHKRELYAYIYGIIKNRGCKLKRMNGIPNHIHMLVDTGATCTIADLVRDIKRASSYWMKNVRPDLFPLFNGWGKEYAAFSVSHSAQDSVIKYIKEQEQHHNLIPFDNEFQQLVSGNGLTVWES